MKVKNLLLIIILAVVVFFAGKIFVLENLKDGGRKIEAVQSRTLLVNVGYPKGSPEMKAAEKFEKDIESQTKGKIEVELIADDELTGGNRTKAIELLMSGGIDIDIHSSIAYASLDETISVLNLPFIFESLDDADKKLAGHGGEMIGGLLEARGIRLLAFGEAGFRQLTNTVGGVESAQDIKGMSIRIPGLKTFETSYHEIGAEPVFMGEDELYSALSERRVQGQDGTPRFIVENNIDSIMMYMTEWDCFYEPIFFTVNANRYNSFDDETKILIEERLAEVAAYQKELSRKGNIEAMNKIKSGKNAAVYSPTAENRQSFIEAMDPVILQYRESFGEELINAFTDRIPEPPAEENGDEQAEG